MRKRKLRVNYAMSKVGLVEVPLGKLRQRADPIGRALTSRAEYLRISRSYGPAAINPDSVHIEHFLKSLDSKCLIDALHLCESNHVGGCSEVRDSVDIVPQGRHLFVNRAHLALEARAHQVDLLSAEMIDQFRRQSLADQGSQGR